MSSSAVAAFGRLAAIRSLVQAGLMLATVAMVAMPSTRHAWAETVLRVGVMGGDGEELMETVAVQAAKQGVTIKIVPFSDYTLPNEALNAREIDANAFQHQPYLDNQIKTRGYQIVGVAYTIVAPIGLYSHKYHSVADLPQGARIGIPNDPSNGGRGLLLLQHLGLVKLREGVGILPTVRDIVANPRDIRITELDAGIIARSIDDLDAAVINTDWALKGGLDFAHDRIAMEPVENNPYRNIIAVHQGDENRPGVRELIAAYHSEPVRAFILSHFKGAELPAW